MPTLTTTADGDYEALDTAPREVVVPTDLASRDGTPANTT